MTLYDKTNLWKKSLAAQENDNYQREREKLRVAYEGVRERAAILAGEISSELPDYTVHDITHLDALWEYADLVIGESIELNPCEAFVLGCAFLIHDLGMGLAAYAEGISELKKLDEWRDAIAEALRRKGVEVNDRTIEQADGEIEKEVLPEVLRQLHAKKAEKLAITTPVTMY